MFADQSATLADTPTASYLEYALWIGLAIFTILTMVLVWTRWGQVKPLWKCLALSVFAHILLGGYAYGTKLFFQRGIETQEQPISFSVQDDEIELEQADLVDAKTESAPWEQVIDENSVGPESIDQPRLESHETVLPEREASETKLAFQEHKVSDVVGPGLRNTSAPELPENQPFEIQSAEEQRVAPTKIASANEPSKRDSQAQTPESVNQQIEKVETRINPTTDSVTRPQTAQTEIKTDAVVNQLRNRIAQQQVEPIPNTTEIPDANSLPESTSDQTQWKSAAWNGEQPQLRKDKPAQPRRLGDGLPIPKVYQNRFLKNRTELVIKNGGSKETELAVQEALRWLGSEQSDDGRWNPRNHNAGVETNVYGHNRSGAGYNSDSGITGLVVLSFLGAGHTHLEGPHQKTVQKALEFLIRTQNDDGSMYGSAGLFARTYCHAMAMLAITEAYALTGDKRIQPFVKKAQQYTVSIQNQTTGGWRYRPGDDGDMSQFGWQVMALVSAERAGIPIPDQTRELMIKFLASYSKGKFGGISSYRPAEGPSRTMTAEALLCKRLLKLSVPEKASDEAVSFVLEETPSESKVENLYYWYYATLAMHHEKSVGESDGSNRHSDSWSRWNRSLSQKLLSLQEKRSTNAGSFPQTSLWSSYGGRYYSTAMATLSLEAYYRYQLPPQQDIKTARR